MQFHAPKHASTPTSASRRRGSNHIANTTHPRVTPGLTTRTAAALATGSMPIPDEFKGSRLLWAAAWCKENGVTLPPDTCELRSLRNWFCNQLQRWKKKLHSPGETDELVAHGIDFAQYKALNTGKGARESDDACVAMLKTWKTERGSYDLAGDAPPALLAWQKKCLARFFADGRSKRMLEIETELPGFRVAMWRAPYHAEHSQDFIKWMDKAQAFESAAKAAPAFRGQFHPTMDPALVAWARLQQKNSSIEPRARGILLDLHILANASQIQVNNTRESHLADARALSSDERPPSAVSERRLTRFLGAALFARKLHKGASDIELMTEFAITPDGLDRAKSALDAQITSAIGQTAFLGHLCRCRDLFNSTCESDSAEWLLDPADAGLYALPRTTRLTLAALMTLHERFAAMDIPQELA
jgi:hypothetical protein